MIIKNISFLNVRKIALFNEQFLSETNIIIGPNGSGKTSILEAIYFLSTGKSFRKKHSQSIIKNEEKQLQIQGTFDCNKKIKLKLIYDGKKKQIFKDNKIIKTTTELLNTTSIVCISPEETDIIEGYKKEKQQYFDKIIFKIKPKHIQNIKEYNKILLYRNSLLENNMETGVWDEKLADKGLEIWKTRKEFFVDFLPVLQKTQNTLETLQNYTTQYHPKNITNKKDYIKNLQKKTKNNKTEIGPHKDSIELLLNNKNIKEYGSQGEKKLLKYILKLSEVEILKINKKQKTIILLDDFFAKLDNKNIMKIFSYFHRKFQVIITTTNTNDQTLKQIQKDNNNIKIFEKK
mgnify:CR=1 FL=1|tara:strand:- start:26 stop:1066 length:1041 start_codon:yes stop_codon:yes gene_type:complete